MNDRHDAIPTAEATGIAAGNIEKQRIARLSIASNTFLVITKFAIGLAVGSVSIISEAIHTGIDLVAAVIAYVSVKKSSEPADEIHSFGHGKFEDISGLAEAMLIFVAASLIIYESVRKLLGEAEPLSEDLLLLGIGIMAVSAAVNYYVSTRLMDCAKRTESIALESDAWHLRTDVYTSLGILAGLAVIRLTGFVWLDPLFAIAVAAIIIKTAYDLTRRSFSDLLDQQLPDDEVHRIIQIICDHRTAYADFHGLRTRRGGPERFIEFHVLLAKDLSVQQAHDLADHLEDDIRIEFPRTHVTIHMEPCEEECATCEACCNLPRTFCPVQKTER